MAGEGWCPQLTWSFASPWVPWENSVVVAQLVDWFLEEPRHQWLLSEKPQSKCCISFHPESPTCLQLTAGWRTQKDLLGDLVSIGKAGRGPSRGEGPVSPWPGPAVITVVQGGS